MPEYRIVEGTDRKVPYYKVQRKYLWWWIDEKEIIAFFFEVPCIRRAVEFKTLEDARSYINALDGASRSFSRLIMDKRQCHT